MVMALVQSRILNGKNVPVILHNADHAVIARRVGANGADRGFSDIVAGGAEPEVGLETRNNAAELVALLPVLLDDVQYVTESRFSPYARQLRKGLYGLFDEF